MPRKRKNEVGPCRLCGVVGPLSFEHVPPKKAFNKGTVWRHSFEEAVQAGLGPLSKGRQQQGGAGAYTLCERCNNDTGSWYADDFSDWCRAGANVLQRHQGEGPLAVGTHGGFPLRVIKQVLTMFASVNPEGWREEHPALREYLLCKTSTSWPVGFRVFVYYTRSTKLRNNAVSVRLDLKTGNAIPLAEVNFPPFGYVLTLDGAASPDPRLAEITSYRSFGYDEAASCTVDAHILDVELAFSGDYRTRAEIQEQARSGGSSDEDDDD